MVIESIELKNFRNYKDLNIEFDKWTNILYGDNANLAWMNVILKQGF